MSEQVRKTILVQLDVVVSDESEDYLEAEVTHPRLSGALYLTVNCRKELEQELEKIDMTDVDQDSTPSRQWGSSYNSESRPVIALGASPSYTSPFTSSTSSSSTSTASSATIKQLGPTKLNAAPVDSLVKNTVSLAGGLIDFASSIKRLRKK